MTEWIGIRPDLPVKDEVAAGNDLLPLRGSSKVALFRVNSYDFLSGGLGLGCVNVPCVVDMVQGLKDAGRDFMPLWRPVWVYKKIHCRERHEAVPYSG